MPNTDRGVQMAITLFVKAVIEYPQALSSDPRRIPSGRLPKRGEKEKS